MSKGKYSGQFLITYDSEDSKKENLTSNARLTAIIELSHMTEFLKFQVNLNDIPVINKKVSDIEDKLSQLDKEEAGKDVVINWEFLSNFNTNNELWYDANGLEMVHKKLWKR